MYTAHTMLSAIQPALHGFFWRVNSNAVVLWFILLLSTPTHYAAELVQKSTYLTERSFKLYNPYNHGRYTLLIFKQNFQV
jgi:hypothetical protein